MKTSTSKWTGALIVIALVLLSGQAALAILTEVGPTAPGNGFPVWYSDTNGLALELCLPNAAELAVAACLAVPPNPAAPILFPQNFPDEAFWFDAGAGLDVPAGGALAGTGRAILVLALEAAFAGNVAPGEQISFGRLRYRVDVPVAGTYTIITPYGTFTEEVTAPGISAIFTSRDIGINPGVFTGALNSDIGPFLRASNTPGGAALPLFDGSALRPGAFYLVDPAVAGTAVTGGPNGNIFRVEGPPGSNFGGPGLDFLQTDQFSLQGRLFSGLVPTPLSGLKATYSRLAGGTGFVNVFAVSPATAAVSISDGTGEIPTTSLAGDPGGNFFARIPIAGATVLPAFLTFSADNSGNNPNNSVTNSGANLVDVVTITLAEYNPELQTLTIQAESSDAQTPPVLTAVDFGDLVSGNRIANGVVAPPLTVTVNSSKGGTSTREVLVGNLKRYLPIILGP